MTDMNNDKKTAGAAPGPQAAPPASPKTTTKRPAARPPQEEKPVRRVGSITLGLCLIAVGVCFLLYYFAPGFNWLLVAKVGAPLALVALGVEVIWCAAHPGRWKYDFLAVFGCLVLMGGAFCLTLLPLFWQQVSPERRIQTESLKDEYELWQEVSPERRIQTESLKDEYEQALYGSLQDTKIQLFSVHTYMDTGYGVQPQTLAELNQPGVFLSLGIDLYGPYDRTADFAKDCALLRDAVKQVAAQWGPMPEKAGGGPVGPDAREDRVRVGERRRNGQNEHQPAGRGPDELDRGTNGGTGLLLAGRIFEPQRLGLQRAGRDRLGRKRRP